MKLIAFGLLCLLSTLVCSIEIHQENENISDLHVENYALPLPISLNYVNGNYVLSIVSKLNWFQATAACARMGYQLIAIPTQRNQTMVFRTIRQSGYQGIITEPVWTSGSNQANINQWSWYTTGKSLQFHKFLDLNATATNGCLGIDAATGSWSVEDCAAERYFMCEKRCA